ncbi:hypothetical protein [Corynebacterium flavescens]|uniref:Uncharacterized protein n=1 Tax=Corynebacterium flavescens TaxID=28028 RepID=A0A1L7CNL8_CORFL|nr:hypothetical protein [Corynebacterium flavescens]APT87418.1 hypothetical protein CFLV_09695 [Corynebacterium flavescens]KAA8720507.1 hypothetical protein F4V60_09415 [Corynebacterium flavescens]GEB97724.1 hypothetical protein CFL01nite_12190 [Corynebacterium flavescens]
MHTQTNTPAPAPASERDPFEKVILQSAVLKKLNGIHKTFKEELAKQLTPGDKKTVKNAQGLEIGSFSVTAPGKKAVCTDPAVLLGMAEDAGAEIIDLLPHPSTEKAHELVTYLAENRPDLLDFSISNEDEAEISGKVLEHWQVTGELPAGWEIKESSSPSIRVTPGRSKVAKAAIEALVQSAGEVLEITDGKETK